MNTFTFAEGVITDVRHALRMIRTKPAFSAAALLSLALGIGANTAIFSVLNGVLIRPLPYPSPDTLVSVTNRFVINGKVFDDAQLSPGMYAACRDNSRVFGKFGVWTSDPATLTGMGEPEQIMSVTATQGVLPALGVSAVLGRWFSQDDDTAGAPETVILSHGFWQRKFGGRREAIGSLITIDFVPRRVVGVMPRDFRFLNLAPDVFLPQRFPAGQLKTDVFSYSGIGRLRPGATIAMANEDTARVWKNWGETAGVAKMLELLKAKPNLHALKNDVVGDVGSVLTVIMGALALVLLLVCANVANLVLVRAESRRQELAVRVALGASRGRIARELLVESFTLGVLGGTLGLALAYLGLRLLVAQGPGTLPRLAEISLDQRPWHLRWRARWGAVCCSD